MNRSFLALTAALSLLAAAPALASPRSHSAAAQFHGGIQNVPTPGLPPQLTIHGQRAATPCLTPRSCLKQDYDRLGLTEAIRAMMNGAPSKRVLNCRAANKGTTMCDAP